MNKNILIIGNYGNYNIGDELLLKIVALDLLEKEKDNDIKIYVPVRDPDFVGIYHTDIPLNSFYIYDIRALVKYLFAAEKIIVGGGGLWDGYTGRLSRMIPIFLIASKILGKTVIVRSVGIYNTASKATKILINLGLLFTDQCSVRDKESFDNIWNINKRKKIENDLALQLPNILENGGLYQKYENLLKKTSEYKTINYVRSHGKFVIGISVKQLNNAIQTKNIVEKISNFINIINSEYLDMVHFIFFPFAQTNLDEGKENDMILINNIINKVKFKDNIIIVSHMNPILWYLLVMLVDILIGMRFHSIVFAFLNNKPFVAIPYENKVWNFIKSNNCSNVLPLENLNEDYLVEFFKNNFKIK